MWHRESELLVHYQGIDAAELRMLECIRQAADDFETVGAPGCDGALIGADDEVELHCPEAVALCVG